MEAFFNEASSCASKIAALRAKPSTVKTKKEIVSISKRIKFLMALIAVKSRDQFQKAYDLETEDAGNKNDSLEHYQKYQAKLYEKQFIQQQIELINAKLSEDEGSWENCLVSKATYDARDSTRMDVDDKTTSCTPHEEKLSRLSFEMRYRTQLLEDIEKKKMEVLELREETKSLETSLKRLPVLLEGLESSSRGLQVALNLTSSAVTASHLLAASLPMPLYTIFAQLEVFEGIKATIKESVDVGGFILEVVLADQKSDLISFEYDEAVGFVKVWSQDNPNTMRNLFPDDDGLQDPQTGSTVSSSKRPFAWAQKLAGLSFLQKNKANLDIFSLSNDVILEAMKSRLENYTSLIGISTRLKDAGMDMDKEFSWSLTDFKEIHLSDTLENVALLNDVLRKGFIQSTVSKLKERNLISMNKSVNEDVFSAPVFMYLKLKLSNKRSKEEVLAVVEVLDGYPTRRPRFSLFNAGGKNSSTLRMAEGLVNCMQGDLNQSFLLQQIKTLRRALSAFDGLSQSSGKRGIVALMQKFSEKH